MVPTASIQLPQSHVTKQETISQCFPKYLASPVLDLLILVLPGSGVGKGGNAKQIIMCYELSTHTTYPFFKRLLTSLSLFGDHRYNFKPKPKLHRDIELNTDMPPPFSCANNSRITYPTYLIWPYNHRISFILKTTITKSGW